MFRFGWAFDGVGRLAARAPALTAALVALVAAAVVLGGAHRSTPLPIPRSAAVAAVLHDRSAGAALATVRYTRSEVFPIDARTEQVSFYRGAQLVFQALLRADGTVLQTVDAARRAVPYGSQTAYRAAVLIGLGLLFVLLAGVVPLRRIRNLDVAMLLALTAPMVLMQHRFLGASAVAAVVPLAYLSLRCARTALGLQRPKTGSAPLYDALTASWSARERRRTLGLLAGAAALAFAMVGISSTGPVDVIYAVMEGATRLVHGALPYGHLPSDVVHGDTYPILSYALYAPVALVAPVSSLWDSVDVALAIGVLAALLAAAATGLWARGRDAIGRAPGAGGGHDAGLRSALTLLCFPPLLAIVSSGTTDVALGAILAFAVLMWRRPSASSAVLAAAGWFKLAPFVLLPVWLAPLRGRRLAAAIAAIAAVSAASLGLLVALGGIAGVASMVHAIGYQFSRGSFQSAWHSLGADALQPYGQAAVLAFAVAAAVRVGTDPKLAADPKRIAALAAAVLIGVQLAANYWAYLYLAWIAPLLVMSLLSDGETVVGGGDA